MTKKACYTLAFGILIVLLIAGLMACRMGGVPIQTVRTDKATARVIFTCKNAVNPHTDPKTELIIGGKTYTSLRGSPPFYLDVPSGKRVLFVTHKLNYPYEATLHVFDLETKVDTSVDITKVGFGWNICSGRKPGEKLTDYIEEAQDAKLVISTRSIDWKSTTLVNLKSKSIERQQTFYYDESGHVTNSIVKEGGS